MVIGDPGPDELFYFKYIPSKKHYQLLKQQKEHVKFLRDVDQDLFCYCFFDNKKMSYGRISILRELNFKSLEKTFPLFILYTFELQELIKANSISEDSTLDDLLYFQDLAFKNSIINTYIQIHKDNIQKQKTYLKLLHKSNLQYRIQQLETELHQLKLEYKKIDIPYTQE